MATKPARRKNDPDRRIEAIQQGIVEIEALIRTRQAGVPPF